jgi:hypothetical protein
MPRGRTRTVTATAPPLIPGAKLPPPPELSAAQAAIWDRIIGSLPQGWITAGSEPLMRELCRHIDFADGLSRDIELARSEIATLAGDAADDAKVQARYRKARAALLSLMRAHLLQTGAIARRSQKLRLSKLSQYVRDAEAAAIGARSASTAPEPWTDWGGRNGGGRQ